jgi:hypothetical protein
VIEQILCILENFQTLIVGTIGFAGVVYTIYKNAQIAREQTDSIRSHNRDAFRTAIYCELETIKDMFETRAKDLGADPPSFVILPELVTINVYASLRSKIGLLTTEEITPIIKAYLLIEELPMRLKVLADHSEAGAHYEGYIYIGKEQVKNAGKLHESFLIKINEALNAIKI